MNINAVTRNGCTNIATSYLEYLKYKQLSVVCFLIELLNKVCSKIEDIYNFYSMYLNFRRNPESSPKRIKKNVSIFWPLEKASLPPSSQHSCTAPCRTSVLGPQAAPWSLNTTVLRHIFVVLRSFYVSLRMCTQVAVSRMVLSCWAKLGGGC